MSSVSGAEYAEGKRSLLAVMQSWESAGARSQALTEGGDGSLEVWLHELQTRGWNRHDVYNLLHDVYRNHAAAYSESTIDELGEFETGIVGNCDIRCITRFPGDPLDPETLAASVRAEVWR